MMTDAVGLGVNPKDVHFFEYNDDTTYGTNNNPTDFAPLFSSTYGSMGKNVFGKAITTVARKVHELGTYEAYREWFDSTYKPLFVLII